MYIDSIDLVFLKSFSPTWPFFKEKHIKWGEKLFDLFFLQNNMHLV